MSLASRLTPVLIWEPDVLQATYLSHLFSQAGFKAQAFIPFNDFKKSLAAQLPQPLIVILAQDSDEARSLNRCRRLRQQFPLVTLIVISHRQSLESCLAAFKAGADDYLSKPLNPEELIVRAKAHLERSREILSTYLHKAVAERFGELTLLPESRTLLWREQSLSFSALEFKLLHGLCACAPGCISREQVALRLWQVPLAPGSRKIDNLILGLRKKLPEALRIDSAYGQGYRLILPESVNNSDN